MAVLLVVASLLLPKVAAVAAAGLLSYLAATQLLLLYAQSKERTALALRQQPNPYAVLYDDDGGSTHGDEMDSPGPRGKTPESVRHSVRHSE